MHRNQAAKGGWTNKVHLLRPKYVLRECWRFAKTRCLWKDIQHRNSSQSRNKFARAWRAEQDARSRACRAAVSLLQFLPYGRSVSVVQRFPVLLRRGGDLSRGGWRTITLHLQFHAALLSPRRFFWSLSLCSRDPPNTTLFVFGPQAPRRPLSLFPKTRHDLRNSRSFGERGQTVAKLLGPQMIVSVSFRRLGTTLNVPAKWERDKNTWRNRSFY